MLGEGVARPRLRLHQPGKDPVEVALDAPGPVALGPVEVEVAERPDGWSWSVANRSDAALGVGAVSLVWDAGPAGPDPRFFRHGYQSWSANGVARLGVDEDPSRTPGARSLSRGMHHADPAVAAPGELRSELVAVLSSGDPARLLCAGFDSGATHDGTLRARLVDGDVELAAEAQLGGAVLAPGQQRSLHGVALTEGDTGCGPELLAGWAERAAGMGSARAGSPFVVGWCSWYQYFASITEELIRENLALAGDWPFDLFQVDDGYQAAIGDWLTTNDRFPAGLERLATEIAAAGRAPGIWLAPFMAAPGAALVGEHPDWVATHASGAPLVGMLSPAWGGAVHVLDTTRPEVLAWLEATAGALVALGFGYLKLDFTYGPSLPGNYADASKTPAERVRAGMEAVRRGAGEDAFLLGCGLPLGGGIGVVDGMRIGPDVAPWWEPQSDQVVVPGYEQTGPSTQNAWRSTLARSWQHRRLWINDPDCLMLRTDDTRLSPEATRAWALAVGQSGGMALVSDDLALLGDDARRLLDEVVAMGRAADAAARSGPPPRCDDLLDVPTPGRLSAAGRALVGDPAAGTALLEPVG